MAKEFTPGSKWRYSLQVIVVESFDGNILRYRYSGEFEIYHMGEDVFYTLSPINE